MCKSAVRDGTLCPAGEKYKKDHSLLRNLPRNKTKALAKHGDRSNVMNFSNRKEKLLKEFHEEISKG